jgi:hypothetical protein
VERRDGILVGDRGSSYTLGVCMAALDLDHTMGRFAPL